VAAVSAPERAVALDLAHRGVLLAPAVVLVAAVLRGADAAAAASIALGIVLVNFLVSAASITWAARRAPGVLAGVMLGGYLLRLGAIGLALWALTGRAWIDDAALGVTLLAAHLGLLAWETRYVSLSLAFPGLRPARNTLAGEE
jgi:hypothetical protein